MGAVRGRGAKARDLLNGLLDAPVDGERWPFMSCGTVALGGVSGRLFRISFSGEHAYELAVPSRFGASLWSHLARQAEALGGGPYGMEALNVLRIEKGFITHAEIHGRTTAFDVGMDRMVSQKKDCIGNTASRRPGLLDEGRARLVGLKPVEPEASLTAGAHLFAPGAELTPANDQGYLTSVCWSPTLRTHLALGFLANGPARIGEKIRVRDQVRDVDAICEVCDPVFFDPEGGRVRD